MEIDERFYSKIIFGGYDYWMPKQIGAGMRARFKTNLVRALSLLSNESVKPLILAFEQGNDYKAEQEFSALVSDEFSKILSSNPALANEMLQFSEAQRKSIITALLVPCESSPAVEFAYDMLASEQEVDKIAAFFYKNASDKTSPAHGRTRRGKGSARR